MYTFQSENLTGRDHFRGTGVDGKIIILKPIILHVSILCVFSILLVIYCTFNTRILVFQVFLFMATCFGINIPSSGHFFKCCQQLENKIIKIN
jgi:hypothetical protein